MKIPFKYVAISLNLQQIATANENVLFNWHKFIIFVEPLNYITELNPIHNLCMEEQVQYQLFLTVWSTSASSVCGCVHVMLHINLLLMTLLIRLRICCN